MTSSRISVLAATAAAVLWTCKATAIALAGGLDKSPLEGPLFFAGAACFLTGAVALGVTLARRAGTPVRVLAAVGVLAGCAVYSAVISMVVDGLVEPTDGRHWAWAETSLWIGGLTLLVLTLTTAARQRAGATDRPFGTRVGTARETY